MKKQQCTLSGFGWCTLEGIRKLVVVGNNMIMKSFKKLIVHIQAVSKVLCHCVTKDRFTLRYKIKILFGKLKKTF